MKTLDGIRVWNRACDLAVKTYLSSNPCPDPRVRDNITLASVTVATEIAQGYAGGSNQYSHQLLMNARAACAALRTHLYIASQLELIDACSSAELIKDTLEISEMLDQLMEQYQSKYCAWN